MQYLTSPIAKRRAALMLQENLGHQNGPRAMLLGSPDQPNVGHVSVKHRPILTDGCARIYVNGQASREIPVRVTAGLGLTFAPKATS